VRYVIAHDETAKVQLARTKAISMNPLAFSTTLYAMELSYGAADDTGTAPTKCPRGMYFRKFLKDYVKDSRCGLLTTQ